MPDVNGAPGSKMNMVSGGMATESQIARSIFGKPLQSVQSPKRPEILKNNGGLT